MRDTTRILIEAARDRSGSAPKRKCKCSKCGEAGHNAITCTKVIIKSVAPRKPTQVELEACRNEARKLHYRILFG